MWGSITTTEAGMLTDTELIEFPNDFVEVLAEGTEDHREFTLLLFIVNKGPEERWNQMVLALAEQIHFYLLLLSQLVFFVDFVVFVVEGISSLNLQWEIEREVQLFFCALWQCHCFQHLFLSVFESSGESSRFGKTKNTINLNLFILLGGFSVLSIQWIMFL